MRLARCCSGGSRARERNKDMRDYKLETEKRMEKPVLAARESMTETMVRFYC